MFLIIALRCGKGGRGAGGRGCLMVAREGEGKIATVRVMVFSDQEQGVHAGEQCAW